MSLKNILSSFVSSVKAVFTSPQQNREEDDDLTVVRASEAHAKVETAMKAPVAKEAKVKPAVTAKKPRKPRTPKVPEAK